MNKQIIQWYPGHIAKAEKQLKEHLNKVDLVFEVRDARIPLATSHPYLQKWLKGKKQILVINRKDMINVDAHKAWDKKLRSEGKVTLKLLQSIFSKPLLLTLYISGTSLSIFK